MIRATSTSEMSTNTESWSYRRHRRWSIRHCLKGFSSCLIPLMIAISTIVLTVIQLNIAQNQRAQDLAIADNNRKKDFHIANETRQQDLFIAGELHRDTVIAAYVKDISSLYLSPNFSLADPVTARVLRAQTLTALRQLDTKRKSYLIRFLYDSRLIISGENPIDLTQANLNYIDMSGTKSSSNAEFKKSTLTSLHLSGALLINASFSWCDLTNANFSYALMTGIHFRDSILTEASFFHASLKNGDFSESYGEYIDFTWTDLKGTIIPQELLVKAISIFYAELSHGHPSMANRNLLRNGDAEKSNSLVDWNISEDLANISITIQNYDSEIDLKNDLEARGNYFTIQGHGRLSMHQEVNITDEYIRIVKADRAMWLISLSKGRINGRMTQQNFGILYVKQYNESSNNSLLNVFEEQLNLRPTSITLPVSCVAATRRVQVELVFNLLSEWNNATIFIDNIHLSMYPNRA